MHTARRNIPFIVVKCFSSLVRVFTDALTLTGPCKGLWFHAFRPSMLNQSGIFDVEMCGKPVCRPQSVKTLCRSNTAQLATDRIGLKAVLLVEKPTVLATPLDSFWPIM